MIFNTIAITLALSVAASAAPVDPIPTSIPGGCNPAHIGSCPSSYFDTTTSATPVTTSIPGGCNPAHPGSCPSSYFQTSVATPVTTSIPGGCNPAHPGSCPSSYFDTTASATPVSTSIPGGCNPAHPGSCPSSYFQTSTVTPCEPLSSATAVPTPAAPGSNPVLVPGKTWTISNLTRYCAEDNSGCDYNFAVTANDKTVRCTVINMPGSDAATASWSNEKCAGSDLTISWGYATSPAPPFAVITVNSGKELSWFGVSNVNGGRVVPGSPFGSGDFGTLPASPVYTY